MLFAKILALAGLSAAATVETSSVKGKAFDRFVIIYFENQNYDKAFGDPNFTWLANKGITLTNYFAATHPSQPNYMASIAGDYFGLDGDGVVDSPAEVATVIDLLESKNISWAHYEEDMPYTGYTGSSYKNSRGRNDYVRKHNPAIMHKSVSDSTDRLSRVKNMSNIDTSRSSFHTDLENNALPQWMFITPNMTSDGHDSSVTTAGTWCRWFLEPLLTNSNFMQNTLVLVTWDESESYSIRNNILGILVGDAVPSQLVGTTDASFYSHYSEIATVSANWDLPTLGRWDVGANVYQMVANKTGDTIRTWDNATEFQSYYWNDAYGGYFNSNDNLPIPAPNLSLDSNTFNGRHILQSVKDTWANSDAPTYYTDSIKVSDSQHPPPGFSP
ncbi:Phosphoesterase family [Cordyceps fumosorosea ARSEF 2679]|uniref:Phosphoesterase family n=1 Tax=Cordyceps fumosorosea (strain ARSEF 2679) TaxID=1081104 RepID=A0A167N4S8_CORFA|nr:Phosphoesterase family [Cordyceps fumosorosea ARSEF 2679]OAA55126.1 Phosphoesterase family [Cordyceps fumosorosea ARSEF 2679]